MRNRIYLSLFIFCSIFSQGISFLSEENNDQSTNLHIRKKRVYDRTPGGDQIVRLEEVPYVVNIMQNNGHNCGGSILSPNIVITAAHCIMVHAEYHVLSGSTYDNRGTYHFITGVHFYPGYNASRVLTHDFVLLTIYPFINFVHSPNRPIQLRDRDISLHNDGLITGWGSNAQPPNLRFPGSLRSITLPLIARVMCQRYYRNNVVIDEQKFCAFDLCDQKTCGPGDSGNPFVVDGRLAGILTMSGKNRRAPEVFMNLCNRQYNEWIHAQIARLPPNEHGVHVPLPMNGRNHLANNH